MNGLKLQFKWQGIYTFVLNTLTIGIFVFKSITYKRETKKITKKKK